MKAERELTQDEQNNVTPYRVGMRPDECHVVEMIPCGNRENFCMNEIPASWGEGRLCRECEDRLASFGWL